MQFYITTYNKIQTIFSAATNTSVEKMTCYEVDNVSNKIYIIEGLWCTSMISRFLKLKFHCTPIKLINKIYFSGPTSAGILVDYVGFRKTSMVFFALYVVMIFADSVDLFARIYRNKRATKEGYSQVEWFLMPRNHKKHDRQSNL